MKAIVMVAAVLTSAILTVPTVSQAADTKVSEARPGHLPAIDLTRSA
jgi:hypothetical protein